MKFIIKKTKNKKICIYKSLYIDEETSIWLEEYASQNNTSFNNVVISMIIYCIDIINNDF